MEQVRVKQPRRTRGPKVSVQRHRRDRNRNEGKMRAVHATAGGVRSLLNQMAKDVGEKVFATASTLQKAELVRDAGAELEGVDVVYHGVGQATFEQSPKFLRARGLHRRWATSIREFVEGTVSVEEGTPVLSSDYPYCCAQVNQNDFEGHTEKLM